MREMTKIPNAVGCLALGLIGLGTLLQPWHALLLYIPGCLSVFLQMLVLCKLFIRGEMKKICSDFLSLSILAGTSMAMMLSAAALKNEFGGSYFSIYWLFGLALHIMTIIVFTVQLVRKRPGLPEVRGSWLLVYVGISAATISAPSFSMDLLGYVFLFPAGAGTIVLLPMVYRAAAIPDNIPESQQPLLCITAAPVNIWLCGYLQTSPYLSGQLVITLVILSFVLYVPAIIQCISKIRKQFSPAFAAFTFPFVISASALKQTSLLTGMFSMLRIPATVETAIAGLLCVLVTWKYIRFYIIPKKTYKSPE